MEEIGLVTPNPGWFYCQDNFSDVGWCGLMNQPQWISVNRSHKPINEYDITSTKTNRNDFMQTLKIESRHDPILVVIGSTGSCCYDNIQYHKWWHSWYYDDSRF